GGSTHLGPIPTVEAVQLLRVWTERVEVKTTPDQRARRTADLFPAPGRWFPRKDSLAIGCQRGQAVTEDCQAVSSCAHLGPLHRILRSFAGAPLFRNSLRAGFMLFLTARVLSVPELHSLNSTAPTAPC